MTNWPSNEREFQALMEAIDAILQERSIPIPYRQIEAASVASEKLRAEIILADPTREPVPGSYKDIDFSIRLHEWFRSRYGDKLNVAFRTGRMVFLLRGDVWCFNYGRVYGKVEMFCSKEERSFIPHPIGTGNPRYNVLDAIAGLPDTLRLSLSQYEIEDIFHLFFLGYTALARMEVVLSDRFVREAMTDNEAAVDFMLANHHLGQSKWSSLQAAEKILKAYIAQKNGSVDTTHNLEKLARSAEGLGLPTLSRQQLSLVQCQASVRYGDIAVDRTEALAAHHASLAIISQVALSLMRAKGISDDVISSLTVRRSP